MNRYTIQYLPIELRDLYISFCSVLMSNRSFIKASNSINNYEALDILSRCLLDMPEAINFKCELYYKKTMFGQVFNVGELPISGSKLAVMRNELNEKVNQILSNPELKACTCDSEVLQFIYKYIQSTAEYDKAETASHKYPLSHTAYGSLVNQLSVCDGNAKGMILLCQKLGIPCMGIDGIMDNGKHSWVMVQCNGKWFHSDPTFKHLLNGNPDYSYWLQSDDEISITHKWNRSAYPVCNHKNIILDRQTVSKSALLPFKLEDAVLVDSIPAYQRILRTAIANKNKKIIIKFDVGFGVVDPKNYIKVFERIMAEILLDPTNYKYEYYKKNRIMIIEWE